MPDPQAARDPQVQAILNTQAMHDAQTMRDAQAIESTVNSLRGELRTAANDMRALGLDDPVGMRARLTTLQQGIDTLTSASRRLAERCATAGQRDQKDEHRTRRCVGVSAGLEARRFGPQRWPCFTFRRRR